jgi:hypothetical protein
MRLFATAAVALTLLAFGAQAQTPDTTAPAAMPDTTAPAPAPKHKSTHGKQHHAKHSTKHTKSADTASR